MCQPGIMKQIMDGSGRLTSSFDNLKSFGGWIYHSECKQRVCVLGGVFIVKGPTRSTQTMTQVSDSSVLGGKRPYFLRLFLIKCRTGHLEQKRSTSCVGTGHIMVFLIICSVQVSLG
jgi:hypothetical protein